MSITVRYEELQSTAGQLRSGGEQIRSDLARLQAAVNGLVSSGFVTDQASGRFQASYDQWTRGAQQMLQGLDGMSQFLDQAIARHQQLDSELSAATGG